MARQRKASYQPELTISKVLFDSVSIARLDGVKDNGPEVDGEDESKVSSLHDLQIPLRNIGLGAAHAVSLHWSFDLAQAVKVANDLAQRTLTPIYFSVDELGLRYKSEAIGEGVSVWINQREESIDYVLPASIDKVPVLIRLPHTFTQLAEVLVYLSSVEKEHVFSLPIPTLTATLKFSDIGGEVRVAVFEVTLALHMLSHLAGGGLKMSGSVESSRTSVWPLKLAN